MRRNHRPRPEERPALSPFPNADEIAARAHELFISGGRQVTRVHEYWCTAEDELLERAARRIVNNA